MKMKKSSFLMLAIGLGISLSVQAEMPVVTLSHVEGVVLVNQGKQFAQAQNGMSLSEGDRILTMQESQVALRSEEYGCSSFLQGNALLTITDNLNCETLTQQKTEPLRYAAVGDTVPQGGGAGATGAAGGSGAAGGAGGAAAARTIGGISTTTALIAGGIAAAIGTGVGVGLTVTSSDDNPPVSAQ